MKIDHTNCSHPRNAKGRAACRASRVITPRPVDREAVIADHMPISETLPAAITGADRAARLMTLMAPLVSKRS